MSLKLSTVQQEVCTIGQLDSLALPTVSTRLFSKPNTGANSQIWCSGSGTYGGIGSGTELAGASSVSNVILPSYWLGFFFLTESALQP